MKTFLTTWNDERAELQAFLKGETETLEPGWRPDCDTDTPRGMRDSMIMLLTVIEVEATGLGMHPEDVRRLGQEMIEAIEAADRKDLPTVKRQLEWRFRNSVRTARADRYSLHVNQALKFIHQHLHARITAQTLAEFAGVSERHLGQQFRQEVGETLTAYITRLKMDEAKELLRSGRYTVAEIADTLGYSTVSYFCAQFKKTTKISPKQYQQDYSS